jgi:predicted transcriptional regulator
MRSKSGQIELLYKKPLEEILSEMIEKHGSVTATAKELGVTQGTVSLWLKWKGLKVKTIVVRDQANQIA